MARSPCDPISIGKVEKGEGKPLVDGDGLDWSRGFYAGIVESAEV